MAMKQRLTAFSLLLSLAVTAVAFPAFAQAKKDDKPAAKGDRESDTSNLTDARAVELLEAGGLIPYLKRKHGY